MNIISNRLRNTELETKITKTQLENYIKEAQKLKNEMLKIAGEIKLMNKQIFDVFSKRGFKTIEERIKILEDTLMGKSSDWDFRDFTKTIEKVDRLEKELNELKRGSGRRY
jgi:uncharacterized protein (UPF0335 family)